MTDAFEERLRALAEKARAWRLAGDHHNGRDSEFPLVGKCFDNAYVVYNLLLDEGFSPLFVEGTTDRVADDLIQHGDDPSKYETTEELAGLVHYWVEVEGPDGQPWTVDISSDTHDRLGEVVVEPSREPEGYFHLPDSIREGEQSVHNSRGRGDRCEYCGDHRYTRGGCPACHDDVSPDLD